MKISRTIFSFGLVFLVVAQKVTVVHAAPFKAPPGVNTSPGSISPGVNTSGDIILTNPLGPSATNLPEFLNSILTFVVQLGTIAIIITLVYVGYLFVAARGAPAELSKAKSALLYTIIGALILLGAQVIAMGIQATVAALQVG